MLESDRHFLPTQFSASQLKSLIKPPCFYCNASISLSICLYIYQFAVMFPLCIYDSKCLLKLLENAVWQVKHEWLLGTYDTMNGEMGDDFIA